MLIKSYEIYKKNLNSLNCFLIYGENIGLKQEVAKYILELREKSEGKYQKFELQEVKLATVIFFSDL